MSGLERAGGNRLWQGNSDPENEATRLLDTEENSSPSECNSPANHRRFGKGRVHAFVQSISGFLLLLLGSVAIIVGLVLGLRLIRSRTSGPRENGPAPDPFRLPLPQPGLRNPSYLSRGRNGAVASEAEVCSAIGIDILKDGGKAIDAAIGTALCSKRYENLKG